MQPSSQGFSLKLRGSRSRRIRRINTFYFSQRTQSRSQSPRSFWLTRSNRDEPAFLETIIELERMGTIKLEPGFSGRRYRLSSEFCLFGEREKVRNEMGLDGKVGSTFGT